ncbi:MAG: replicative helicase [Actinomycetota bacterium]|nr:replicative helicase [Actinomycetota bacterium]
MDRRLQILADRSLACRPDKLPMLADLGESGALEQDSDIVAFIYRDDTYNTDSPDSPDKGTAEIIVAKHRNGPTAKIRLAFLEHLTKFSDLAR